MRSVCSLTARLEEISTHGNALDARREGCPRCAPPRCRQPRIPLPVRPRPHDERRSQHLWSPALPPKRDDAELGAHDELDQRVLDLQQHDLPSFLKCGMPPLRGEGEEGSQASGLAMSERRSEDRGAHTSVNYITLH